MFRKRLLGMLATILLALSATPAAAIGGAAAGDGNAATGASEVTTIDVAKANGRLAALAQQARDADPEVDQEVPGVGRLLVDVDEEEGSLTIGVEVTPLGVDETVTVGGTPEEPAEEPAADEAPAAEDPAAQAAAEAAAKDELAEAKADAVAAGARGTGSAGPAFEADEDATGASGDAEAGTGVARSVPAPDAGPDADVPNAATDFVDEGSNAWLRLMGTVLLAGTGTAWAMAKRHGLA